VADKETVSAAFPDETIKTDKQAPRNTGKNKRSEPWKIANPHKNGKGEFGRPAGHGQHTGKIRVCKLKRVGVPVNPVERVDNAGIYVDKKKYVKGGKEERGKKMRNKI
jgi:hypothetical protein